MLINQPHYNLWRFWRKNLIKLATEYNECHQYSYMEWKHGNEMKNHHCVLTVRTVMANIWKFKMLIIIKKKDVDHNWQQCTYWSTIPIKYFIIMKFPLFVSYFANEVTTDLFLAIHYTWSTSHMYQYVNSLWIICSVQFSSVS